MNVPNIITLIRIALTPVFILLYYSSLDYSKTYAIIVFFVASFTDWYDGYYARKYNIITRMGQFLDPLADKILNLTVTYIMVCENYIFHWIFWSIMARDGIVTILRLFALHENQPVITSKTAQWKTAFQMFILMLLLLFIVYEEHNGVMLVDLHKRYDSFLGISWLIISLVSIYTLIDYFIDNWNHCVRLWLKILRLLRLI